MLNHPSDGSDTIVALASPPGGSLRGVLRLSGPEAFPLAVSIFRPFEGVFFSSSAGKVRQRVEGFLTLPPLPDAHGYEQAPLEVEATLYLMPVPRTYTREDVVEFHLPGAPVLLRQVTNHLLECGARLADPGEFTLRAFLHGRIDLAQAEAVEAIIAAGSENERRAALSRVEGCFSQQVLRWKEQLVALASDIESQLDFEEEEVAEAEEQRIASQVARLRQELSVLISPAGSLVHPQGRIPVLFAGLTNAGKSSLINSLLGYEAALVSAERSTTRDLLGFEFVVEPFHFLLQDSPGYDALPGRLAQEATERGRSALEDASLVVLTVDSGAAPGEALATVLSSLPPVGLLIAIHKSDTLLHPDLHAWLDRCERLARSPRVLTSSSTGAGLEELRQHLLMLAVADVEEPTGQFGFSQRVNAELKEARGALAELELLISSGEGFEVAAEEIRRAHRALGHILGEGYAEEVLSCIFSRFCIGK